MCADHRGWRTLSKRHWSLPSVQLWQPALGRELRRVIPRSATRLWVSRGCLFHSDKALCLVRNRQAAKSIRRLGGCMETVVTFALDSVPRFFFFYCMLLVTSAIDLRLSSLICNWSKNTILWFCGDNDIKWTQTVRVESNVSINGGSYFWRWYSSVLLRTGLQGAAWLWQSHRPLPSLSGLVLKTGTHSACSCDDSVRSCMQSTSYKLRAQELW